MQNIPNRVILVRGIHLEPNGDQMAETPLADCFLSRMLTQLNLSNS